jgi:hypothetical protein
MADLTFNGISVATIGPALGHEMFVDDVTLLQAEQAGQDGSPVKVFVDHDESIDSLIGFLSNFRIEEDQLRADLGLIESHPQSAFYAEILTKAPNRVGFSMTFSGKPEEVGTKRFARVANLVSVDLVSRPAANPDGVFRAGSEPAVDTAEKGMTEVSEPVEAQFDAKAAIDLLVASVAKLEETVAALAERDPNAGVTPIIEEEPKQEEPAVEASEEAAPEQSEELSALAAKVAELEVALAAKGTAAISSNQEDSNDPVSRFKAAAEAKDWKTCTTIFSQHRKEILRSRK